MIQKNRSATRKIILSLIILLVTIILSFFGVVFYSVEKANQESRTTIEGYTNAVIEDKLAQQKTLTKDYAYWEDTIQNAFISQDLEWIKENIGEYLTDTFKVSDLFIINSQNEAVLLLKDGVVDHFNYTTINRDALTVLFAEARQSGTVPEPVSGIVMINGTPALVGVAVLAPEDGTSLPSPRPLLVLAKRLETEYLQDLSKQYRLRDLHFKPVGQDSVDKCTVKIMNPMGKNLGRLVWQPENPGNLVLSKLQLPIIILIAITALIATFIIKSSRTTALRLEKAYQDLEYNAYHDALTGLANRRLFNELLLQAINTAKRDNISCALLYIDLDDFKKINDEFGHKAGDHVLVTVAERIKSSLRESDATARIGGDEFIVLLHNSSERTDIQTTAEKILARIIQPVTILNNELQISASIGITIMPDEGVDPDVLMTNADLALYNCKKRGRNTFQFFSELDKSN